MCVHIEKKTDIELSFYSRRLHSCRYVLNEIKRNRVRGDGIALDLKGKKNPFPICTHFLTNNLPKDAAEIASVFDERKVISF